MRFDKNVPPTPLPIDSLIPEILASLQRHPNLVLEAEPGAGKTTRVPPALLDAVAGQVLVLEPRRIAARLAARRVASELSQELGETVGYQVRFERIGGSRTRLHFLTEGVLTRRLLSDPDLDGVDVVILDEFHERHLETDLALALLKRLQQRRPNLHLVVMSATLDAAPVAAFLGECPVLRSKGRLFDLTIDHAPYSSAPLHVQVKTGLEQVLQRKQTGHVLVFLPGSAEIRRTLNACQTLAQSFGRDLLPLYGDLPSTEQDRAVAPSAKPKIILSTNLAESSITIDGVTTVIDSGLARIATYSPWSGLPTLTTARISKASARQRAGRAGRTGPGHVLRLYSELDYHARNEHDLPEIQRADLVQLCLALRAMGIHRPDDVAWLDLPPQPHISSAEQLLDLLLKNDHDAATLMQLPVHPRLARMISAAAQRGVAREACVVAALLSSGERTRHIDLLDAIDQPLGMSAQQQLSYLLRLVRPSRSHIHDESALLQSILLGFPDRVAKRQGAKDFTLSNGITAEVTGSAPSYPFAIALDAEDRNDQPAPVIRLLARVEPEWLLDLFPDRLQEQEELVWNSRLERVDYVSRLLYDRLILQESISAPPNPEAAADLLARMALEAGAERFLDLQHFEEFKARVAFAGLQLPDLQTNLAEFSTGLRSFSELKKVAGEFLPWLEQKIGSTQLREHAPPSLRLKAGRQVKIHYESGKPPWIASRLQDFFGMEDTPRIGSQRTPVVVHLLAPNQRPVQTTTDLAGFWQRLYPQVRRELMRRYPRHQWPETPRG